MTTPRWSPAWPGSMAAGWSSSASRRAPTPTRTSGATSGCRTRRATARRCGSWSWASASGCRSSPSWTCPARIPGPDSEERGIAEAIARSIGLMSRLRTPIVTIITGEGGSGGALAIAVGDVVIALENSVYSVISPEGCASILWRTADEAQTAALAMKMTADDQAAARRRRHRRARARRRRAHRAGGDRAAPQGDRPRPAGRARRARHRPAPRQPLPPLPGARVLH